MTCEATNTTIASLYSTPTAQPITVGIADDHPKFCQALAHTISNHPELSLSFTALDGSALVEKTLRQRPHIVITDMQMPLMDGAKACQLINEMAPEVGVIALTMHCDQHHVWQMRQAGARGYLMKGSQESQIFEAIQQVHYQGTYWCSTASKHLETFVGRNKQYMQPNRLCDKEQFSELEINVMRGICMEKSCKLIADELHVCKRTIDSVYERLRRKTGAQNLVGIALYAIQNGWWKLTKSLLGVLISDHLL